MPNLHIAALPEHYYGLSLSLEDDNKIETLAVINGNKPGFNGPVVVLNLDQHVVYGLSLPSVISNVIANGPQELLASKEAAHKLFEHGMKASVGTIKVGNCIFTTTLSTFYTLKSEIKSLSLVPGQNDSVGLVFSLSSVYCDTVDKILICNAGFIPKFGSYIKRVEINFIKSVVTIPL